MPLVLESHVCWARIEVKEELESQEEKQAHDREKVGKGRKGSTQQRKLQHGMVCKENHTHSRWNISR